MTTKQFSQAVVLLSGGLDSTTVLAIAQSKGYAITAVSFRYGQKHVHEAEQAKLIAKSYGVSDHVVIDIDLSIFGNSALTSDILVPKNKNVGELSSEELGPLDHMLDLKKKLKCKSFEWYLNNVYPENYFTLLENARQVNLVMLGYLR